MARQTFYRRASMAALAADAASLGLTHDTSLGPAEIPIPSLTFGAPFLERWPVREQPGGAHWRDAAYTSYAPWVFTFADALVHSAAGIVCTGGFVVEETLVHTDPLRHGYLPDGDGVWIAPSGAATLAGTHVSVLAGSAESYYHALIDGVARLSVVPPGMMDAASGLLTAPHRPPTVAWLLDQASRRGRLRQTVIAGTESRRVERLVLAGPSDSSCNYHPSLAAWFGRSAASVVPAAPLPTRFYVDRRSAAGRPLANEAALAAALETLGVRPVVLEGMDAEAQIALFRGAELIVAPHGAGLANLVFATPGCRVIELQMDAYCHWCFRRLAALKRLPYDCLVGRVARPWPDLDGPVHAAPWEISVPHVAAAVQSIVRRGTGLE